MNIYTEPSPPLVSIIIRTKNEERWIDHCLSTIATQNIKDITKKIKKKINKTKKVYIYIYIYK